jgi:cytochrome c-type biogenesis protein CcmH
MAAIALAFILPTLLQRDDKNSSKEERGGKEANLAVYRDQLAELKGDMEHGLIDPEQHAQDRDELERRLLDDVSTPDQSVPTPTKAAFDGRSYVYAIALGIPLIATALYLRIGHPSAISATPRPTLQRSAPSEAPAMPEGDGERSQADIEANVAALAKRLEENPGDLPGWIMLGRSYMTFKKFSEASAAYAKATALKPNDPDLLADYAFALAMANGQKLEGQPLEVINKALKIDPQNAKALELAGSAAFQAGDYKQALVYWESLMKKLPPGSEVATALTERIEETKAKVGDSK